jgi:hypothetical protein
MPLPLNRFASPNNSGTLANGTLHTDFAPTRDASIGNASSFTYKDCRLEIPPSEIVRGKIATYYPSVFGEVVSIIEVSCALLFYSQSSLVIDRTKMGSRSSSPGHVGPKDMLEALTTRN